MFHFQTQQPPFSRYKTIPIISFLGDLAHQYFVLFILICDEYYWNFFKNPLQNHDFKHVTKHGNCVRFVHHKTGQCFRDWQYPHLLIPPCTCKRAKLSTSVFVWKRGSDMYALWTGMWSSLFPNSLFLPCILAVSMWSNISRPWFVGFPKLD